ncbi:MAG: hypothetical protein M3Z13_04880 [Candidatus Dormibacteraeota bacterium]|nr:hypothetical protein [Candidatus Dormibacteraeota bacterium]
MRKTLLALGALVLTVFVFDQVSRHMLGLDCIGPYLPVWGCLAAPYPGTFAAAGDLSGSVITYGGIALGAIAAAFVLGELGSSAAAYLLKRYRPDLLKKMGPDEEPRTYRVR